MLSILGSSFMRKAIANELVLVFSDSQGLKTYFYHQIITIMLNSITTTHTNQTSVLWYNRIALFVVFFWFGLLKILGMSPAEPIVSELHRLTIAPLVSIHVFLPALGLLECAIGLVWLFPRYTRLAFVLFCGQMFTTFLPLLLMPHETWQSAFALSLSGQYIVKNVVLIASALTIYSTNRSQW